MSVSSTAVSISYIADGVGNTFAYPNYFLAPSDLVVSVDTVSKVLGTDYTVQGSGGGISPDSAGTYPGGANVVFASPPAVGAIIRITRSTPQLQPVVLQPSGPLSTDAINHEFDRLTLIAQEILTGFVGDLGAGPPTAGFFTAGSWAITRANWITGGYFGIVCVASGTPGSWLPFGSISLP